MRGVVVFVLLLTSPLILANTLSPDAIAGVWQTASKGYVQIYKQRDTYVGIAVGDNSGKPRFDINNPDKTKRGRALLGVPVIRHLRYDSDNDYDNGRVYDPENGKTYKLKAELIDRNTLHLRGYIGISLFGRTETWHRISPDTPNVHPDVLHHPLPAGPGSADQ